MMYDYKELDYCYNEDPDHNTRWNHNDKDMPELIVTYNGFTGIEDRVYTYENGSSFSKVLSNYSIPDFFVKFGRMYKILNIKDGM